MRQVGSFAPRSYGTVAEATAELIKLVGGLDAASQNCSRGKSQLHKYTNQNEPGTSIPVHVALELEEVAGHAPVTEHMAGQHNMIAIKLPPTEADREWLEHVASITKEFSNVIERTSEFLRNDGDIDSREAAQLLKEIDDNLRVLADMRYDVEQRRLEGEVSAA